MDSVIIYFLGSPPDNTIPEYELWFVCSLLIRMLFFLFVLNLLMMVKKQFIN
jgi:hypothetical protein